MSTCRGACLNCRQAFGDPHPHFCPACGQETNVKPPTLLEFAQQFGGAYLSTEGALWRSLALLLFKPGELTRRYLAGQRRHYVLPLRLYLTISVSVLLALRLTGAGGVQVHLQDDAAALPSRTTSSSAPAPASAPAGSTALPSTPPLPAKPSFYVLAFGPDTGFGMRHGVFFCEGLPGWLCQRAQRHIDIDPKSLPGEIQQFKERFVGNLGAAMFLLLPTFALWMKLVYLNRPLRYTEHLVFALHLHAFWFLALGLAMTGVKALGVVGISAVPAYMLLAARRVYGGRRGLRWARALAVSMLHLVVMSVVLAVVALWSLLS